MEEKKSLSSIMSWINQICWMITNHGLWKIFMSLFILAFASIIITFIINPSHIFNTWDTYVLKKHTHALEYRIEVDRKITKIIKELRTELDASRVFLLEPHNGTVSLNGLPFWYVSLTIEDTEGELESVQSEYKNIDANRFPIIYEVYSNYEWNGTIDELEKIDKKLSMKMRVNDADHFTLIAIHGVNNLLGFLGITYIIDSIPPSQHKINQFAHSSAQRIGSLLDGYKKWNSR